MFTSSNLPAPTRSSLISSFYPSLDGLRGVAILMVFALHFCLSHWNYFVLRWAWAGVDLFFVLSGFLITGILYDSLQREHYFRNFYIRRALRIFPIFYGFWLVLLLLTPLLHIEWNRYNFAMMTYTGNFFLPGGTLHQHPNPANIQFVAAWLGHVPAIISVGHFWSLCVEEQFYLLWPAVIWLVRKRETLLRICIVVILVTPLLRGIYGHFDQIGVDNFGVYANTLFRTDTLLLGAAIALWLRGTCPSPARIRRGAWTILAVVPLLFAIGYCSESSHLLYFGPVSDRFVNTMGYSLIALIAGAVLLLAIDSETIVARLLLFRPLGALGRISYGFYVYHDLPDAMVRYWAARLHLAHATFVVPLVMFPCAFAVAWLSFRYIETPFLRLKKVLAPEQEAHRTSQNPRTPIALLPVPTHG